MIATGTPAGIGAVRQPFPEGLLKVGDIVRVHIEGIGELRNTIVEEPELGGFTLKVMRDGRPATVEVTADGAGLVSHAGAALLGQVADKVGLTNALSLRLAGVKQRRRGHDPGHVVRDLDRAIGP